MYVAIECIVYIVECMCKELNKFKFCKMEAWGMPST